MRFRGLFIGGRYFIGAITLAIVAIAGAAARGAGIEGADEHAHHHAAAVSGTRRTTASYAIPYVRLLRQDGAVVNLGEELNDGRPVVLSFIYTSCATVCPLVSHTLSQLQSKLGDNRDRVHLVSITIDPEQDDPSRRGPASKGSRPQTKFSLNFPTFPNCTPPGDAMTQEKLHAIPMEDLT